MLGNHDYIYVYDTPSLQTGYNAITHILINAVENKKIKNWLINLPIILEVDNVSYSHAGITNEWFGDQDGNGLWNDLSPIKPAVFNTNQAVWGSNPQPKHKYFKSIDVLFL